MKPRHILFSFDGRISRRTYWLSIVPLFIAVHLMAAIPLWIFELTTGKGATEMPDSFVIALFAAQLIWLAGLWPMLAVGSKRLHDRDKRGLWLLAWWVLPVVLLFGGFGFGFTSRSGDLATASILMLASLPLALWGIVELGILPGTQGPNRYGPDPTQSLA